jgi:hypothetical protein
MIREQMRDDKIFQIDDVIKALGAFDEVELRDVTIHVDRLVIRRAKQGAFGVEIGVDRR